ncbi:TetR/AcrR family transcriptional regulator [Actinomadura craniellae]|uniref:TetR/AcrR family transcriptional regulator n=1 Tax=Actinomadura craniellae TaxID=2231787 RepID=A0A365GZI4_9ACTN|nr:TetR/AcrR family transcriptional regulator [Actinomadura craniellae]RAY12249.1 TetR/AcrR family transcriptional regulator [Actinomadura craniellae]
MTEPDVKLSARKEELLQRTLEYVATHSLSDLSLRPLAREIGSSPRVLLYLFDSKEGLIRAVLARSRAEQTALLHGALAETEGAHEALQTLWEWCVDPAQAGVGRLFFEAYVRSLGGDGTWRNFAADSLDDWLPPFRRMIEERSAAADPAAEATLVLAVLRGLMLDLLAGRDRDRVTAAWRSFLADRYP